jgi:HEPN domain-containing protein
MFDIEKQVAYWRDGAVEDWDVAQDLLKHRRMRHGLFLLHLALEKLLKAHVCRRTNDLAPRLHNLVRLAELAQVTPTQAQLDILADINTFNLEGRYPDMLTPVPSSGDVKDHLRRAEEVYRWLLSQLSGQ